MFPVQNFPAGFRLDQPERIPSSLEDTDDSTRKTVQAMSRHIRNAQSDPWFLAIAHNLTRSRDIADKIQSVFLFCKAAIRFQRDEQSVWNLYKEINQIDFLIEPRALARMMPKAYGDCDEFTMFSLACLTALGVPCEIVTVACDRDRPGYWSHVYGQVVLEDGRRMALDCSPAGKYPGWEVPDHDVQRKQAWDLDANQVNAVASKDLGLHAYIPRRRAMRGRRRGVGDDVVTSDSIGLPPGSDINIGGGSISVPGSGPNYPTIDSNTLFGPITSAPSSSSFNWNSLMSNLASIGTRLGTIALTPKGGFVQTGPGGQTIVSNTGLPAAFSSFGAGLGGGSMLLWLALGIGAVMILGSRK